MNRLKTLILTAGVVGLSVCAYSQTVSAVVNAGDFSTAISPGTVIAIQGENLASQTVYNSALPLPTSLGGVTATFTAANGASTPLPLLAVSPSEIRAQLPYDIEGTSGSVSVSSSSATFSLSPISPRLITIFDGGPGDIIMYHADYRPVTRLDPVRPGESVKLFAHGLGQTTPPAIAGADPGSSPFRKVNAPVSLSINGLPAQVTEAILLPGNPGVYQVTVTLPYDDRQGTVPIVLTADSVNSQSTAVVPLMPNGFYYQLLADAPPTPTGLNGLSGATSSIATRHDDLAYWGANGFRNWTKLTGVPVEYEPIRGIAITLRNQDVNVFSNHSIESRSLLPAEQRNVGSFYNNANGVEDGLKPGLMTIYSMSNLFNFVGGGFFRVSQPVTFDTVIGYFDGNGDRDLPLDLSSPYIRFRMNIWSNAAGNVPRDTSNFSGDILSTDTETGGAWSWSYTGVDRIFRDTRTLVSDPARRDDPISRMVYKLGRSITLQPGDYWFSHDAVVPAAVGDLSFPAATPLSPGAALTFLQRSNMRGPEAGQKVAPTQRIGVRP